MIPPWKLTRLDNGAVVVSALEVADAPWSRFRGLQLRAGLAPGSGLLLVPCPSVHTFFMRFAIDVLQLDRRGRVLAAHRGVRPWRVVLPVPASYATLELPAGGPAIDAGTVLRLETDESASPPWSLKFLYPADVG